MRVAQNLFVCWHFLEPIGAWLMRFFEFLMFGIGSEWAGPGSRLACIRVESEFDPILEGFGSRSGGWLLVRLCVCRVLVSPEQAWNCISRVVGGLVLEESQKVSEPDQGRPNTN